MEQRYATNPAQIAGMTTADLRAHYLVDDLFVAGEIRTVYTHHDRIVLGGVVPAGGSLDLPGYPEIRSDYFLEHREVGIVNVGAGTGTVTADGETYELVKGACLYLGRGIRSVSFADEPGADARFYLFSAPAHTAYPAALVSPGEAPALRPEPSLARNPSSGEPARILANSSLSCSALIFANSRERPRKTLRSESVFRNATTRWPVRTWPSP